MVFKWKVMTWRREKVLRKLVLISLELWCKWSLYIEKKNKKKLDHRIIVLNTLHILYSCLWNYVGWCSDSFYFILKCRQICWSIWRRCGNVCLWILFSCVQGIFYYCSLLLSPTFKTNDKHSQYQDKIGKCCFCK